MNGRHLVLIVCVAQVAAQLGAYVWAALLPELRQAWGISPAEAGLITGAFYLAYMISAPVLVSLTDRIDPKWIYLFGATSIAAGHFGFAYIAEGLWTAIAARAIAGLGWAGVYMTGLKLLADRVDANLMRRAVAWHAAGIGAAGAISFIYGDLISNLFGWNTAFAWAGWLSVAACALVVTAAPSVPPPQNPNSSGALLDFRPVLKNRSAMAYAVTYCIHTYEMSVLRGWGVAFLVYVASKTPDISTTWFSPALIATLVALVGTATSVYGNGLSIKFGRPIVVKLATSLSAVAAIALGFLGPHSYWLSVSIAIICGALIWLDSSTLTGGTSDSAEIGRRGQTLALHTTLGYAGGAAGPMVMGLILATFSEANGYTDLAWGLGFLHVAFIGICSRFIFSWLNDDKNVEGQ